MSSQVGVVLCSPASGSNAFAPRTSLRYVRMKHSMYAFCAGLGD